MRSIGILLLIIGIGSFVLHSMDREFRILQWIDKWGPDNANYIRIGLAVLGAILIILSLRKPKRETIHP